MANKSKRKFRNSTAAKQSRENRDLWLSLKTKWDEESQAKKNLSANTTVLYKPSSPIRRDTGPHIPSLSTDLGACTKSAPKIYTGDKIIGIGVLHKSNAVPVFSNEEAVEISKMRRG